MRLRNLGIATLFMLAACGQATRDDNRAIDTSPDEIVPGTAETVQVGPVPADPDAANASSANNSATAEPGGSNGNDATATVIPAQYRGRWGLVAADCTSTRGDNKGLMTVNEKTIRFYESTATLREQRPAIATSFSGVFDFTGEGQQWTKVMTFTRTGDSLKRAQDDGVFNYRRCA